MRFLGASSLLIEDGRTAILSDPFASRPGKLRVLLARIAPDSARIRYLLACINKQKLDAVFTTHSHYDHAMDAPSVARATSALLIGSESTREIARGLPLAPEQIRAVVHGDTILVGGFRLTFIKSLHSPGDRYPGKITSPLFLPAPASAWKTGTTWSVLVEHDAARILLHGSAGFKRGMLAGRRAEVVYLGIGALSKQSASYIAEYWNEVVRATGAKRVVVVHWDDFFRPLSEAIKPMPLFAGSLTKALEQLAGLAANDGVELVLPTLWAPTDPVAGLHYATSKPR